MKKLMLLSLLFLSGISNTFAQPIFIVTPNVRGPSELIKGEEGTAIFQVTNNSKRDLYNIGLVGLPTGVSQTPSAGFNYCTSPFSLAANANCLIKIRINSGVMTENLQEGPKVCFTIDKPVYCSQPLKIDQLATAITSGPVPQSCNENIANFNYELLQIFDSSTVNAAWGPLPNTLMLSPANPDLTGCAVSAGATWMQQRILAAADFWIKQKLNYCHHHVPDYMTVLAHRGAAGNQGGYCNPAVDLMPGSIYFNQQARWNYSGNGSETLNNWVNNNLMWYGLDCSNYTAFLYNFAFGIRFDSEVSFQAGQRANGSQDNLSPNQQTPGNELDNPNAPGKLVCVDNTLEVNHSCAGHGGYFSVINSQGVKVPDNVTELMLASLHPGDLLYIADRLNISPTTSEVTHVVMWTGKKIGSGPNEIPANKIAPNSLCPQNVWMPQPGQWVITDSHYQGADYRMFTDCFYKNNLWGVRRVII